MRSEFIAERDPGLAGLERGHDGGERLFCVGDLVLEDGGDAVAEDFETSGRVGQQRVGRGVNHQVLAHLDPHRDELQRKARWAGRRSVPENNQ